MMAGPDHLGPAEQDLARLAASVGISDSYLVDLVELADRELAVPVGLLLNGMIAMGVLTTPRAMAEELDAARSRLAALVAGQSPEGVAPEVFQEQLREFGSAGITSWERYEQLVEELEEQVRPFLEDGELDFDRTPADIARRLIQIRTRRFLTLRDVQVFAPGQAGIMRLKVMRVMLDHVAAWWIIEVDEDGQATFQLFQTEGQ
ncbi:MAG TPA: hypothetical protein VG294_09970 [Solirubrobacteraceae bacterium]|jgi:hypothetical protein|nr:hypothetical protein [Solirubrobacteraceae bacterium]